jgi:hypothetical protein
LGVQEQGYLEGGQVNCCDLGRVSANGKWMDEMNRLGEKASKSNMFTYACPQVLRPKNSHIGDIAN